MTVSDLLSADARYNGLDVKTPIDALPADITPEWKAAREALEKAADALDEFDTANDDLLSESWKDHAEAAERRYVAAIQAGNKPPARPRGGYVTDAEDKRPSVVGEWSKLRNAKFKADQEAWALLVQLAPSAVPDAHAEIVAAGDAYIAAQEAMEKAREAFEAAFNKRHDLEKYAAGTNQETGWGLPEAVVKTGVGEPIYSAKVIVENALRWLDRNHGPADDGVRFPAKRRMRGPNGAEFDMEPALALQMERSGSVAVDGFPPEAEIHGLRRGGRANVSDRVGPGDSKKFNDR